MKRGITFKRSFTIRVSLLCFILILVHVIYLAQTFRIQILKSEELGSKADNLHNNYYLIGGKRGSILDRKGDTLAFSIQKYIVAVQPDKIKDAEVAARELSPLLEMSFSELREKLDRNYSSKLFYLKNGVEKELADRIEALEMEGITLISESRRVYPYRELASNVIGFTDVNDKGLEGLEFQYNKCLAEMSGRIIYKGDIRGRPIPFAEREFFPPHNGDNLILTIDRVIQYYTESEIKKAYEEHDAECAIAIVMDPRSGEILAMADIPTYDPNNYSDYDPTVLRNRAVTDVFEPGSSFKFVTAAGALEEGVVTPDDRFLCEGRIEVAGRYIHCVKPHGAETFTDVIKNSCNVGIIVVGSRLGKEDLYSYIREFGFGRSTKVGLPGESVGLVEPPEKWYGVKVGNIPIGQGISVTPLQLITALSAIANNGLLMEPMIVKAITDAEGNIKEEHKPEIISRVVSRKTARQLKEMLRIAVAEGTGKLAAVPGYQVAGKTGTAQKLDPEKGDYSFEHFTAIMIGFVPVDEPQLAILVLIDEPKDDYYGAHIAAPVFSRIAQNVLRYINGPLH